MCTERVIAVDLTADKHGRITVIWRQRRNFMRLENLNWNDLGLLIVDFLAP